MSQMDHVRKELQDYQVPVDTDKLWANTAHAIPQRRRRRGIVFWWMTGGMGVTVVMIALVSLAGGPVSIRPGKPMPIQPDRQPNSLTRETASQDISQPADVTDIPVGTPNPSISQTPIVTDQTATAGLSQERTTHQGTFSHQATSSASPQNEHQPNPSSIHSPETGVAVSQTIQAEKQTDRPADVLAPVVDGSANTPGQTPSAIDRSELTRTETDLASPGMLSAGTRSDKTYASLPLCTLALIGEEEIPGEPDQSALPATAVAPPVGWERTKKKPAMYVTALQGIGFSGFSVRSVPAEGPEETDRWAGSMRGLEYLSSHLQGGIRLPSGLMAGLGIRYGRLTTEQAFTWQVTERISGDGTSVVIIGEDGSLENVSGEVITTRRSTFQSTRYNRHSTLDLDATIAYPVWRRPGFELLAWLRGGLNLRYDVTGSVPNTAWQPVRFDATSNPFRLASPLSWGAGLEARVRATRHLTLHARAGYDRLQYTLQRGDTNLHFHHPLSSISLGVGYVR